MNIAYSIFAENQVGCETGSPGKKNQRGQLMVKKKNEYIESFTMHGLSRILTGTRAESFFWLIVLTGALILGTSVVVGLVQKYLKYQVYTEITQKATTKNYFPSITFCDETLMLNHYFKVCGHDGIAIKKNQTCTKEPEEYKLVKNTLKNGFNWSNNFFTVTDCSTWGNKQCADDKFLQSVKRFNNSCFTWNFNGTLFDIYGHADISFKTVLKENTSIIALIHDPKIKEIDLTKKINLDPNKTYQMRIQKTEYKRLPHPFPSKCTNDKPHDIFPGKYTRHKCIESIAYSKLLEKCGGVYDYHKRYIPSEKLKKYARPNKLATDIHLCLQKESFKETNEETGKCPFPCEETEFPMTTTFNKRTRSEVKKDGGETVFRIGLQHHNVDSYRLIEEKQLYGWDQILGEIGGLVGLVLGASIISLLELFAFLLICFLQKLSHE